MELKDLDKKILFNLDFDARMSISELSKKVNSSKQRVLYRLKKMEEEGIIKGYYTDIDPSALGLVIYLVYFKFQNLSTEKEKKFVEELNNSPRISVNASVQGRWDHSIAIFAKDLYEYKKIYDKLVKNYEKYLKEKKLTTVTDFYYYSPKFLFRGKETKHIESHGPLKQNKIDKIDEEILKNLAKNARISLIDLAEKTKLTAPGVRARINSLEKKRIILSYRVMIDYEKLKKMHYRIFLFLENDSAKKEELIKFLGEQDEVISITKEEGYSDLDLRVIVNNLENFYEFIKRIKTYFPNTIKDYEPLIYYKFYKSLNYYPLD